MKIDLAADQKELEKKLKRNYKSRQTRLEKSIAAAAAEVVEAEKAAEACSPMVLAISVASH